MATYTSSQVASGQIPINERGASFIVFGSIALTTALANNDIVQLVTVPNGYRVRYVRARVEIPGGPSGGFGVATGVDIHGANAGER